ncbi:hypothetical protein IQA90_19480, partial [Leptospira interrogans serovar Pomona]|nr:hypothetical protein [Leptospira interrogans serovar Pomona]
SLLGRTGILRKSTGFFRGDPQFSQFRAPSGLAERIGNDPGRNRRPEKINPNLSVEKSYFKLARPESGIGIREGIKPWRKPTFQVA